MDFVIAHPLYPAFASFVIYQYVSGLHGYKYEWDDVLANLVKKTFGQVTTATWLPVQMQEQNATKGKENTKPCPWRSGKPALRDDLQEGGLEVRGKGGLQNSVARDVRTGLEAW